MTTDDKPLIPVDTGIVMEQYSAGMYISSSAYLDEVADWLEEGPLSPEDQKQIAKNLRLIAAGTDPLPLGQS